MDVGADGDADQIPLEASLPGPSYTAEREFARERDGVLFAGWFCVGREESLAGPGDYLAADVAGESILVVRGHDGLAGFYNLCRHRGSRLVPAAGSQPAAGASPVGGGCAGGTIRCPYHGWTYGLDGSLRSAPFLPDLRRYRDRLALHPVGVATWGGFVFARANRDGASLESQLNGADLRLADWPLAALRAGRQLVYQVAANWKVIAENYNECYHCGPVHPELCELVPAFGRGGGGLDWEAGIPHRDGAWTFTLTGTTRRAPFPGLPEAARTRHLGELVLPNLMLSLSADHVAAFTLWPHDAGHTTVVCDFLFHPDEMAREDFDPADAVEFWDLVNRQDWAICEQVQDGMRSRMFTAGYLAPMEQPSADVGRYVTALLSTQPGSTQPESTQPGADLPHREEMIAMSGSQGTDHRGRPWSGPPGTIGRRGFLRLTGAAGLLGAAGGALGTAGALTGCSSQATAAGGTAGGGVRIPEYVPGPQPASGGRYGGTVAVVWSDPPNSLDPAVGYNITAWDAITELVCFGGLMAYDKQLGGPVANLAAGPPSISADSRTLTFKIRDGVRFHNGRELVASDFIYSWERMLSPALASWATSYLTSIVGADALIAGKTKALDGVEAPDDRTLVVHLTAPDFTILNAFALPFTAPVPREEVERLGDTKFGLTPVGTGPFRIVSYDGAAQTARFERFDQYMYQGLPYLDAVTYRWGVDPEVQLLELESGAVDLLGPGIPSSQAAHVLATPTLRALTQQRPSPGNLWLTIYQDQAPLRSQQVRQALNWAVDRAEIGRVTYGTYSPWGAPFPAQIADFTPVFTPYGYDQAKARQLLAEAGYPDGFSAVLTISSDDPFPTVAQIVQSQLAAVGVRLSLNEVSADALLSLEEAEPKGGGHLQLDVDNWYEVQPTPADEVDALYVTGASSNYNSYSNPQVDALAAQARQVFDVAERNRLYAQIQQIIGEDAPFVFLESALWLAGVGPRLRNYQYRGETYTYYDRLWVAQ